MSEIAKTGAIGVSLIGVALAYIIRKSYSLESWWLQKCSGGFSGKIRSQHAVWMPSAEVCASFRGEIRARSSGVGPLPSVDLPMRYTGGRG